MSFILIYFCATTIFTIIIINIIIVVIVVVFINIIIIIIQRWKTIALIITVQDQVTHIIHTYMTAADMSGASTAYVTFCRVL